MKNTLFRAMVRLLVLSILSLFGTACNLMSPPIPKEVNAVAHGLPHSNSPWNPGPQVQGKDNPDLIEVLVCTDSVSQFAKTRSGKWETYWYLCKFKIITSVAGGLDENEIAFVYKDAWPTPEAAKKGLRIDKLPFPYFQGNIFLFAIQNKKKPYKILDQEERSFLPPYGPMNFADQRSLNHKQLSNAIDLYYKSKAAKYGGGHVVEETEHYIIFRARNFETSERLLLMIDRKTLTVKSLPPPEIRNGKKTDHGSEKGQNDKK